MIVLSNTYAIYLTSGHRDLDHRGTRSLEFKTKDEKDREQDRAGLPTPVVVPREESYAMDEMRTFRLSMENVPEVTHPTA